MFDYIQISRLSLALINKWIDDGIQATAKIPTNDTFIAYDTLVSWLNLKNNQLVNTLGKEKEFLLASLQAQLLADLQAHLSVEALKTEKPSRKASVWSKIKFAVFVASGALFAACEGFDSITTMLSVVSMSAWIIIAAGLVFAVLSVVVFYGLNLIQVSQDLGVRLRDTPKLIDVYIKQLHEIKSIRQKINQLILSELDAQALAHLNTTLNMLKQRLQALGDSGKQFELALSSKKMQIAKVLFAGLAGLMCFGAGFFAAQSVAVLILGLFSLAITPAIWPIMLFSVLVGAAAFNLYWYNDRDNLKKLISSWLGLNEDKIESLANQEKLTKESDKIDLLTRKIQGEVNRIGPPSISTEQTPQPGPPKAPSPLYTFFSSKEATPPLPTQRTCSPY